MVKARTFSKSLEELWFAEWRHPRKESLAIDNPANFLASLQKPVSERFAAPSLLYSLT
jgi:hypothetical protein